MGVDKTRLQGKVNEDPSVHKVDISSLLDGFLEAIIFEAESKDADESKEKAHD